MSNIKDNPNKNTNGFAKNPQNINRKGRPVSLVKKLRKKLLEDPKIADQIVDALLGKAKNGLDPENLKAIREMFDRVDGKSTQTIEHTGNEGGSINVRTWVAAPTETNEDEEE